MKKSLFIAIAISTLTLWGCGDKDKTVCDECYGGDIGITDVTLPPSTTEIQPGDEVTIQGTGFQVGDLIRGYTGVTRATHQATPAFETAVTSVTATSATFTLPSTLGGGEYILVAVRSGETQALGTLTVGGSDEDPFENKTCMLFGGGTDGGKYKICGFEWDDQTETGKWVTLHTYTDGTTLEGLSYDKKSKRIWAVAETGSQKGFGYYDVMKRKAYFQSSADNIHMFGNYRGSLRVLYSSSAQGNNRWTYGKLGGTEPYTFSPQNTYGDVVGGPNDLTFLKNADFANKVFIRETGIDEVNNSSHLLAGYTMPGETGSYVIGFLMFDDIVDPMKFGVEHTAGYDHTTIFNTGTDSNGTGGESRAFDYSSADDKTYVNHIEAYDGDVRHGTDELYRYAGRFHNPAATSRGKLYALKTTGTGDNELYELEYPLDPPSGTDDLAATKVAGMPSWVTELIQGGD